MLLEHQTGHSLERGEDEICSRWIPAEERCDPSARRSTRGQGFSCDTLEQVVPEDCLTDLLPADCNHFLAEALQGQRNERNSLKDTRHHILSK